MISHVWSTLPFVMVQTPTGQLKKPDFSAIAGATGFFNSAGTDGESIFLLAEVEDGL